MYPFSEQTLHYLFGAGWHEDYSYDVSAFVFSPFPAVKITPPRRADFQRRARSP